jgi:hypothetical protein
MRKITETPPAQNLAATADDFYGAPPLFEGEHRGRYQQFLACVIEAVKPRNILERILVDDYCSYAWEVKRLRGLKAALLNASLHQGTERVLRPILLGGGDGRFISSQNRGPYLGMDAKDWAERQTARDPEAIKKVDDLLKVAGLTRDAVVAHTLAANLSLIDCIDQMIMAASKRRDAILREIERRRASLADNLRRVTDDIEKADCEIVTPAGQSDSKT